jgi:steroid delta-isomerase-like uncharacterized protein
MLAAMLEANKILAREWFEQVWNQRNESAIDRLFSAQGVGYGFTGSDDDPVGRDAFKEIYRSFCGAFPDIHIDVLQVIAEADMVALRWKATMTLLGNHLGFPATGKKGELNGSTFIRIEGDQIVEGWNQMDLQSLIIRLQAP